MKIFFRRQPSYKSLVVVLVGFRILYAAFLTVAQYYVWSKDAFTRLLLNSPRYFLFYAYGRFWLNPLIAISVAFAFYLFLRFLKKYRERFFEEGETELGFLASLLVGWPNFVIFGPLVFVLVVFLAVFRRLVLRKMYTTLGWPFIWAALLTLIWGSQLISILHLGVLRI